MYWKRNLIAAAVVALFSVVLIVRVANATESDESGDHKTPICHRTASDTNPYVYEEVDDASLDAHLNNLPGHPARLWKSDGTFLGVAHLTGDPKNDYVAEDETSCQDPVTESPSPTATPSPSQSGTPTPTPSGSSSSSTPTPSTITHTPTSTSTGSKTSSEKPEPRKLAMTGFDSWGAGAVAGGLALLGLGALWYARRLGREG